MARTARARSWWRWVLAAGAVVATGGAAVAQLPPDSSPEGAPADQPRPAGPAAAPGAATPGAAAAPGAAADDNLPDTPEARAILKRIKQAERAAYERHDHKRYVAMLAPGATVAVGRTATADAYDRRYDFATWTAMKKLETTGPVHKHDLLFFRAPSLTVNGAEARLEIDMRVDFFGGHRVNRVRYDLKRVASRPSAPKAGAGAQPGARPEDWQVEAVRYWPLAEQIGGEVLRFDAAYWAERDKAIESPQEGDELHQMARYLFAWRFAEAVALLEALVVKAPGRADAWLALARLRLEMGQLDGGREAFARALALNPDLPVPAPLASHFPKAKNR